MDEYSWASAVGRVRIKEKELLSDAQLREVAEAPDLLLALTALRDTAYGPFVADLAGRDDFIGAIERALNSAYDYVMSIAPIPILLTAFRGRHDFHNLKTLVKAARAGDDGFERAFSYAGNFSPEELRGAVSQDSGPVLPEDRPDLKTEIKALLATYDKASAISGKGKGYLPAPLALLADSVIDRSYYWWAFSLYKKAGHEGLSEFLSAEIDQLNLRIAARATRLSIPSALYADMVLPGGTVNAQDVSTAYEEGFAAVARAYRGTPWAALASEGAVLCEKGESLTLWERSCDDALMSIVRKARFFSLGPEPVFGFIFGKEAEARNLRVILSGKQSGASDREIAERLRDPYV